MCKRRLTFVLAEDNPGDVFLIRRALDEQGLSYEMAVAGDGEEAIRLVLRAASGECPIDLLLVDLNLPKRDGSEVLSELRNCSRLAGVPAILITSSDSPEDRERFLRLGANRFFHKPSDLLSFMEIGKLVKDLVASIPVCQ